MATDISIDDEVYRELQRHARPFEDTPNSVLRRLLGIGRDLGADAVPARSVVARRAPSAKRGRDRRAPAKALLPESEYEIPILQVLQREGGRAPTRDVVRSVGEIVEDRLTVLDKERLKSGGVRWENRVQFARLNMIKKGWLEKGSPRGTWTISDAGRDALAGGSR